MITYTISLQSMEDGSLTAQTRKLTFEAGSRPTQLVGEALRSLLKWTPSYKKPILMISHQDEVVGMVKASGKGVAQFTTVNMEVLRVISESRFTTDEVMHLKASSDPLANSISKAFGHKGTKISVVSSEERLKAFQKSFKDTIAFAKADGVDIYKAVTPKEVQDWKAGKDAERKQLAAAKKLLK